MNTKEDQLDFIKEFTGYFKHLTTLSTGSIILIATFLEKLFKLPEWKGAVILSLVAFLICIFASTLAYTTMLFLEHPFVKKENLERAWVKYIGGSGILFSWLVFFVGILSFTLFTIKNLL